MGNPEWLRVALESIGTKETPGISTTPRIQQWLMSLKAWWRDDETPWCGVFVAHCFQQVNQPIPQAWYRALGWLSWGLPLDEPKLGCVVVYTRKGGGHVGFVVGRDRQGRLMTLGGNQGNQVSIAPFDPARVAGFRWPANVPIPSSPIPVVDTDGVSSTNEA